MSTASLQRVGLALVLLGGFASLDSSGAFGYLSLAVALLGFLVVAVAWLHDV